MAVGLLITSSEARASLSRMLDARGPLLVEVRFPRLGTSPDWYLVATEEDFNQLLSRLGSGVELHVNSVWDLQNRKTPLCLST